MAQPSDYVTTRLSFFELHLAASVGIGRRCKAMRANLRDKFTGRPLPTPWEKDIVGAQGELSAASYFGLYWAGTVGRIDTPDLPTGLEIKTRLHTPGIKEKIKLDLVLPIGTTLPDEARIVLVYGRGIDFDLVGWTTARHAKEKATIDTKQGRKNYYLNPIYLNPIEELREIIAASRGMATSLEEGGGQPGLCS